MHLHSISEKKKSMYQFLHKIYVHISYGYKSPLNFAIQYGFFDKLNTKYTLLHPRFTSSNPIDFYILPDEHIHHFV